MMRRAPLSTTRNFLLLALLLCLPPAAARAQVLRALPSPAGEGSGQSSLSVGVRGRVYLSWVERLGKNRFALRFSTKEKAGWSAPLTVAEGGNWFVNWADFPTLVELPDGSLAAHWLARSGAGTYAYDVNISRSFDGGRTWTPPVTPHRDGTQTEHGFVSMFPSKEGALAAVWLDGREMKAGEGEHGHANGQMTLRYAALRRDGKGVEVAQEALLDARVCECCQTSAALTDEGPVVVYRDRSDKEIRDISVVRLRDGKWTEPRTVHADGWQLDGCPVNGPSIAADRRRVAVAWFTMAGGAPRVRLAFSSDGGGTFAPPVEVDDGDPLGRVDVVLLDDGGAVVSWIERTKGGAEVRARRVSGDGKRGHSVTVAASGTARSSGFPQMVRSGPTLVFSWTSPARVLTAEMPVPAR